MQESGVLDAPEEWEEQNAEKMAKKATANVWKTLVTVTTVTLRQQTMKRATTRKGKK